MSVLQFMDVSPSISFFTGLLIASYFSLILLNYILFYFVLSHVPAAAAL